MLDISKALHELGRCLHFQKVTALKHHIILKPEWVTNAIYKVVKNEIILTQNGCFTTQNLQNLWSAPEYAEVQDELLELMKKVNLCYPLIGTLGTHIAPQLLPIIAPDYSTLDFTHSLTLTYRYDFMPKGLIAPFIVGMYRLIDRNQRLVWRNGVILHDGNAHAEIIESDYHREIQIRVTGYNKRTLLDQIRQKFRDIHATYDDRLTHQELIPCNCTICKTHPKLHRYSLKTLERYLNIGRKFTITCDESFEDVNIRNLISDFPDMTRTDRYDFDRAPNSGIRNPTPVKYSQQPIHINVNVKANSMNAPSQKTQNFNGPMSGVIASDNATVSNNTFTQNHNANTAELLQLITHLRQTATQFPTEIQEGVIIDLEDLETEIQKPEDQRSPARLKRSLIALFTAAALIVAPIAGITNFTNNILEIGSELPHTDHLGGTVWASQFIGNSL